MGPLGLVGGGGDCGGGGPGGVTINETSSYQTKTELHRVITQIVENCHRETVTKKIMSATKEECVITIVAVLSQMNNGVGSIDITESTLSQ